MCEIAESNLRDIVIYHYFVKWITHVKLHEDDAQENDTSYSYTKKVYVNIGDLRKNSSIGRILTFRKKS